jgi:asparagine N-glycosylation enzyme membrane subunit Stt3
MKRFRLFTLVCFAIAMLLYAVAWLPGAIGFGVLGAVFEIVGWWDLLSADRHDEA